MSTHPFQVRSWLPTQPALKLLGQARWTEQCRCQTQMQAERIARGLITIGYGPIMAIVQFVYDDGREDGQEKTTTQYVAWYPDRATVEHVTQEADQ